MTFTLKLEQADGTPADPPTMESTVTNWRTGDTIPLGRIVLCAWSASSSRTRTSRPSLVVEDMAERASSAALWRFVGSGRAGRRKRFASDRRPAYLYVRDPPSSAGRWRWRWVCPLSDFRRT